VYYESLCPDSMWFVKFQLYPTWLLLTGQYLAIDFVPYGKATVSEMSYRSFRTPGTVDQ
jgi:hypothetical protein